MERLLLLDDRVLLLSQLLSLLSHHLLLGDESFLVLLEAAAQIFQPLFAAPQFLATAVELGGPPLESDLAGLQSVELPVEVGQALLERFGLELALLRLGLPALRLFLQAGQALL